MVAFRRAEAHGRWRSNPARDVVIRLSKTADYGLIALKALEAQPDECALSAREISERWHLPVDLTPKVLRKLARVGLVAARRGKNGGYRLARAAGEITVGDVVRAVDGDLAMTHCRTGAGDCELITRCGIRDPLASLNAEVVALLDRTTLASL